MAKKQKKRVERFDLKAFYKQLDIPKPEQKTMAECLALGLEHYYHHIHGYDKYGQGPAFLIPERMYEPYIFGFGAVEVVRNPSLSLETRLKVVEHTIRQTNVAVEYGTPHGLPILLSFVAGTGLLDPGGFRSVMIAADFGGDLFDDWQLAEMRLLLEWLIRKADMPEAERTWWLWHIVVGCEQAPICRSLAEGLLAHPGLTPKAKRALCHAWLGDAPAGKPPAHWEAMQALMQGDVEAFKTHAAEAGLPVPEDLREASRAFMDADFDLALDSLVLDEAGADDGEPRPSLHFLRRMLVGPTGLVVLTPNALKRLALRALPDLGEDPLGVCEKYLDSTRAYEADAINGGVADVIRAHHPGFPRAKTRALVERGLKVGSVGTRRTFYQLGADLFGDDYWKRAAADSAKSIRDWAAKKRAGPARGRRSGRSGD